MTSTVDTSPRANGTVSPAEIQAILEEGICALLNEATRLQVIHSPYGRPQMPDPLKLIRPSSSNIEEIAESDEFLEDDSQLMAYKYNYGFNPLTYLGEWLINNDPVEIKRKEKEKAQQERVIAAAKAYKLIRNRAMEELQYVSERKRSGILFGPLIGEISNQSCVFWAKAVMKGVIKIELSSSPHFKSEDIMFEASADVDITSECSAQLPINELTPNTTYYYRVFLINSSRGFDGFKGSYLTVGKFKTMSKLSASKMSFIGISGSDLPNKIVDDLYKITQELNPDFAVYMGDLSVDKHENLAVSKDFRTSIVQRYRSFHKKLEKNVSLSRLFHSVGFVTAWDDSVIGDDLKLVDVNEVATTNELSTRKDIAQQVLCDYWPVHLHRSGFNVILLNPKVELYTITTSGGFMDSLTVKNLKQHIVDSNAVWKLIAHSANQCIQPTESKSNNIDKFSIHTLAQSLHRRNVSGVVLLTKPFYSESNKTHRAFFARNLYSFKSGGDCSAKSDIYEIVLGVRPSNENNSCIDDAIKGSILSSKSYAGHIISCITVLDEHITYSLLKADGSMLTSVELPTPSL